MLRGHVLALYVQTGKERGNRTKKTGSSCTGPRIWWAKSVYGENVSVQIAEYAHYQMSQKS